MTHTPGPWTVAEVDIGDWIVGIPAGEPGCISHDEGLTAAFVSVRSAGNASGTVFANDAAANARLIAAAPELLAALKTAMPYTVSRRLIPDDKLIIVRAAIAKAEGR